MGLVPSEMEKRAGVQSAEEPVTVSKRLAPAKATRNVWIVVARGTGPFAARAHREMNSSCGPVEPPGTPRAEGHTLVIQLRSRRADVDRPTASLAGVIGSRRGRQRARFRRERHKGLSLIRG